MSMLRTTALKLPVGRLVDEASVNNKCHNMVQITYLNSYWYCNDFYLLSLPFVLRCGNLKFFLLINMIKRLVKLLLLKTHLVHGCYCVVLGGL